MKPVLRIIFSVLLSLLLSGCMMMHMMGSTDEEHSSSSMMKCGMMGKMDHSDKEMKHDSSDMQMEKQDTTQKEYVITKKYCTQCHGFREKSLYSTNEWRPILARMMGYMKKTGNSVPNDDEATLIDSYYGIK